MERPNDKDDKRRGDAERRFCEIGVVDPFDTFQLVHPSTLFPTRLRVFILNWHAGFPVSPCLSLSVIRVNNIPFTLRRFSARLTFCLLKIGFPINVRRIHCRSQVIKYLMILKLLLSSRYTCFIVRLF